MSEQKLTKKQHYIPKMYLKRWEAKDDHSLLVITKKSKSPIVQKVNSDNALFYQDYCYDITYPDGTIFTSNEVEKTFGEYERRHNKLLDRILNRCEQDISILDKGTNRVEDFLYFIALMVIRNPNNNIPFTIDDLPCSTDQLDNLIHIIFGDKCKITALQLVANSINQKHLFELPKRINQSINRVEIYFLKSTDKSYFITSDNPVLCHDQWTYFPLSPNYASFILYDTRTKCKFNQNKIFQLSDEEVKKINCSYWQQEDTFTIIGNNKTDLINALTRGEC